MNNFKRWAVYGLYSKPIMGGGIITLVAPLIISVHIINIDGVINAFSFPDSRYIIHAFHNWELFKRRGYLRKRPFPVYIFWAHCFVSTCPLFSPVLLKTLTLKLNMLIIFPLRFLPECDKLLRYWVLVRPCVFEDSLQIKNVFLVLLLVKETF